MNAPSTSGTSRTQTNPEPYVVRDGVYFIIDASKAMFETKNNSGELYFNYCLKVYTDILKHKSSWNRHDYVGLAFLGTDKGEASTRGIEIVHKFGQVKVEYLKKALEIYEKDWKSYADSTSQSLYPLTNMLWLANRAFRGVKHAMTNRMVIFMTCHDNPPTADAVEKHRIRHHASHFQSLNIQLNIIGLKKLWQPDIFYKDLEILSGSKFEREEYRRTRLKEVMDSVQRPSRIVASMPLRIGKNLEINVSLCSFSVKTSYLKKCYISKETNIPLERRTYYRPTYDDDDDEDEGELRKYGANMIFPSHLKKVAQCGGKTLSLTMKEYTTYRNYRKPGLDLLGFKPIACNPSDFVQRPKFVCSHRGSSVAHAQAFAALVQKCHAKKLMAVCAMTLRRNSPTYLWSMIPYAQKGGFYICKIPFKENVRNMDVTLKRCIFNNSKKKPPTNAKSIEIARRMIKSTMSHFDGNQFTNPKLTLQQQNIETLALNLEQRRPPPDTTLPNTEMIKQTKDLQRQYSQSLGGVVDNDTDDDDLIIIAAPPPKRPKIIQRPRESILDDKLVRRVMQRAEINTVEGFTIHDLRDFLKKVGLKQAGNKAEVVAKVYDFCRKNS